MARALLGTAAGGTGVATSGAERGLAGAFNTNIVRAARRAAERLLAEGKTVRFYLVGRKGRAQLARQYRDLFVETVDLGHVKRLAFADAQGIAEDIVRRSMKIAGDICVYTNGNIIVETLEAA